MNESRPVFIADSCIGGLSVVKSLWNAGDASDAVFLADYAINPLPAVTFLDPGAYCSGLLEKRVTAQNRKLRINVTGDVVSAARTVDFARSHLDTGDFECCIQRRNLK